MLGSHGARADGRLRSPAGARSISAAVSERKPHGFARDCGARLELSRTRRGFRGYALARVYHNAGWRPCPLPDCRAVNRDWGVDSLTYTLYLRWQTTHDAALVPYMTALASTAPLYPAPCHGIGGLLCTWSDAPQWDVVAALREYEVTGKNTVALDRAIRAFDTVEGSDVYTGGGCRDIRYQQPFGYLDRLKTLETEATAVKTALLLYRFTSSERYLDIAIARYARARRYYLDPTVPLYTVFVFDFDGKCRQVPRRFFASVNGEMISNGLALFYFTGNRAYRRQALATAAAVADRLNDARGIFADLQADNDIVEPLVEANVRACIAGTTGLRAVLAAAQCSCGSVGAQTRWNLRSIFRRPSAAWYGHRVANERRVCADDCRGCART